MAGQCCSIFFPRSGRRCTRRVAACCTVPIRGGGKCSQVSETARRRRSLPLEAAALDRGKQRHCAGRQDGEDGEIGQAGGVGKGGLSKLPYGEHVLVHPV